jgi:hypothetical protein
MTQLSFGAFVLFAGYAIAKEKEVENEPIDEAQGTAEQMELELDPEGVRTPYWPTFSAAGISAFLRHSGSAEEGERSGQA